MRKDNAGENMAIIRHIMLNMLNNTKKQYKNVELKALRKKAGSVRKNKITWVCS